MAEMTEHLSTPVAGEYDVIVVGAGPAGVGAALGAARHGARTLLIDRLNCLGGAWTAGYMNPLFDAENKGGIVRELIRALDERGAWGGFRKMSFHYEYMKRILDEKMAEAGVEVLLSTVFSRALTEGKTVTGIVVENIDGRRAYLAKTVIDCTGDGDVAFRAGVECRKGDAEGGMQPPTLMFCMKGVDVQRLRDAIADTPDGASFRLREDERCPMLNDSGLCDIITACGEGALCQICADHPRYRNEFSTFTEVGFGLCCEAAADLTLHWPQPMTWHTQGGGKRPQGSPEEEALLQARAALIRIMQDRTRGIPARLNALCEAVGTVMPTRTAAEWADFLRTLERLDPAWDAVLARLTNAPDDLPDFSPLAVEQFTVYLLHRHVPGALLDDDLTGRVLFCAVSGMLFLRLSTLLGENEAARMYSSEIEYSEENLCSFLDELDAAGDE